MQNQVKTRHNEHLSPPRASASDRASGMMQLALAAAVIASLLILAAIARLI
jgi:hypothetical protein